MNMKTKQNVIISWIHINHYHIHWRFVIPIHIKMVCYKCDDKNGTILINSYQFQNKDICEADPDILSSGSFQSSLASSEFECSSEFCEDDDIATIIQYDYGVKDDICLDEDLINDINTNQNNWTQIDLVIGLCYKSMFRGLYSELRCNDDNIFEFFYNDSRCDQRLFGNTLYKNGKCSNDGFYGYEIIHCGQGITHELSLCMLYIFVFDTSYMIHVICILYLYTQLQVILNWDISMMEYYQYQWINVNL